MSPSKVPNATLRLHGRRRVLPLALALAVGSLAACITRGNDVVHSPVETRTEAVYDLRLVEEFRGIASVTGGEAFALPVADAAGLGPVVDAVAGSFGAVDVAFVVDTTHSMKSKLEALGKNAEAVIARLQAKAPGARVAVVAYRDTGEVYVSRVVSDLSDKKEHAAAALRGLRADGGGDPAEHVYSGLMLAAKKLSWRPEARKAILLVGDAPAHAGHADGATRDAFVEHARTVALSVYAVALPAYHTDVAPGGKGEGKPDMTGPAAGLGPTAGIKSAPGDVSTALDYDVAALKDLAAVAAAGGGMLHLAPCPEELPGVLRATMHALSMRSGGKPIDLVLLLDTSSTMSMSLSAARKGADSAMMDFSDKHADVQVALVLHEPGPPGTGKVESDLTTDYDKVRDAFWRVTSKSGGEGARDFSAALTTATSSIAWRSGAAKHLVLLTDGLSTGGAERDKAVAAARGKGIAIDTLLVGFNPYDGPFDDVGDPGSIDGDDGPPGEVDDLKQILKSFPHGRVEEVTSSKDFEKKLKELFVEIRASAAAATGIEVAFVVDATGSMGSTLDGLARSHDAFHDFLEGGGRVAVVSFRDLDDDYVARKETDFVSDPHLVLKAFGKVEASGGGDLPEAIYYGLDEATRLSWTPGSKRFVILVTDDVSHRDLDKRDAVTAWAKTGDATLFAFSTRFGYDDDAYVPPEPDYTPSAVAKLFKDGAYDKVKDAKALEAKLDEILGAHPGTAKKVEKVDVALIVDTTGSMGDACEAVARDKTRYEKFLDKKGLHRIAVVNYRDEGDDWVSKVELAFSPKIDDIMKALARLVPGGGGDWPEAMFPAIKTASTLGWDAKSKKILVVVTDAEAHDHKKDREAVVEWATKNKAVVHIVHMTFE